MGQRQRHDGPGVWHYVVHRGIARRSVFDGMADDRTFRSRIARASRLGLIELCAWCGVIPRFHLLVRSPACRNPRSGPAPGPDPVVSAPSIAPVRAVSIDGKPYRVRTPPFSLVGMRIPLTPYGTKEIVRFGMLQSGSRSQLSIPADVPFRIEVEDFVKGGETVLGLLAPEVGE